MGCSASKDQTADLATEFFGEGVKSHEKSASRDDDITDTQEEGPAAAKPSSPTSSASQTSSKQQQQQNAPANSYPVMSPGQSSQYSKSQQQSQQRPSQRHSANSTPKTHQKLSPGSSKGTKKTTFVAPISSESFVTGPPSITTTSTPKQPHKEDISFSGSSSPNDRAKTSLQHQPPPPPPIQSAGSNQSSKNNASNSIATPPPPPPPALSPPPAPPLGMSTDEDEEDDDLVDDMTADYTTHTHTTRTARQLDDDDFSVAPSLDVAMRSVVKTSFDDIYKRGQKLGYGAFAMVFIGIHRPTRSEYAIKQVDRSKMFWGDRDALKDEIHNLKEVRDGPNIVQLYEVFEEKKYCYLVTELMPGGELFDRIIEKKTFSEKEARSCCRCVLSALEFMHERRVAHRDLKPENLLLADPKLLLPVKLADFGFAKSVEKKNGCRTLCGTPGYLAPEILERWPAYDVKCDVWSVGVILFLLLGGYLPFDDEDEDKVFDRTRNGQYDFRPQFWRHISNGAKDLVTKCLTINPNKRVDATAALNHEWMAVRESELASHKVDVDKLKGLMEAKRKMKAAVNTLVAANRLQQLNDDFSTYLDRRREESIVSQFSYMTTGTKSGHTRYIEDSPSGKPFSTFFTIGSQLGQGDHSTIYRCIRKKTREQYAVKHVELGSLDKKTHKTLKEEVSSLKLLRGGPHIIRLFDVFEESDDLYLVYEEMRGGDLLSRIVEKEVYNEKEARQVCRIAITAIDYCHKKKVVHRDIKPENFLLVEEQDDTSVKLADFGFAKKCTHEKSLKTLCGTAQYVAPEILSPHVKYYDHRCDLWSLGVFSYVLLGGYPPFEGVLEDLAKEIISGEFEFHEEYWSEISAPAKEMIASLIQVDPNKRASANDALSCKWMEMEDETLILRDLSLTQASIRSNLGPIDKVKSAVHAVMAKNKFASIAGMVPKDTPSAFNESIGMIDELEDEEFLDMYEWGEQIGIGTFSVVHEVVNKDTKEVYAAKRVTRKDLHPSDAVALHDEVAALQQVTNCEHIVQLYDVYDEPDYTYLVLECMRGGDLIDRIIEKRHYTEYDAKEVSRKLLVGVAYCHEKKIANRNLKPENLLLKEGSDTEVKISDFGYAKTVSFPNSLRTQCGTEGYVAPEVLEHRPAYDIPCDIWSLGVIIYIVLGGYRPFRGEGEEVMRQIRYGEYKFHKRYWSHVSDDAKNLITRMLTVDPEKRITAKAALNSRWMKAEKDQLGAELSDNMTDLKNLKSAKNKLKGVVNTVIAANKLQSIGGLRAYQDF